MIAEGRAREVQSQATIPIVPRGYASNDQLDGLTLPKASPIIES